MDRLLLGALGLTVAGLSLLGLLAAQAEPALLSPEDLPAHEGQTACLRGRVTLVQAQDSGASRVLLAAENRTVPARAPFRLDASPGDEVRACGTVTRGTGGFELWIRGRAGFEREAPVAADVVLFSELASRPWIHQDRDIRTGAFVVREHPRVFLEEPGVDARLRAVVPPDLEVPATGRMALLGRVEYDAEASTFIFRIMAAEARDA